MCGGNGAHHWGWHYRESAARAPARNGCRDRVGIVAGSPDIRALATAGKCATGRNAANVQHGNWHGAGGSGGEVQEGAVGAGASGRESLYHRTDYQRGAQGPLQLKMQYASLRNQRGITDKNGQREFWIFTLL